MMEKNEDSREIKTVYMAPPPEWYPLQQQHEDEVDLVTIFGALWRRRRLIVLFAIIAAVLAAGYVNVLVSPKYQVKALVSPGIMGLDDNGVPVYSASFARMAIWLEQGGYVSDLTSQLPPDAVENGMIPGPGSIEAEFPKGGQFLRIVLNTADPEEGEQILVKILDIMKEKETSHEVVKSRMENEIKDMEEVLASWHLKEEDLAALLEKIRRDIASLKSSVKDLEQEIPLDEKYVDQMLEKIASINEDLRKKINQLDDVTEADKTEAFINAYAGVLEQNINYAVQMTERLDMLQAALEKKKWAYEDKINKIQEQTDFLNKLEKTQTRALAEEKKELRRKLHDLQFQHARLAPLEIVQSPEAPQTPVGPPKMKIIVLALVTGLFAGIITAGVTEFYIQNKDRLS
jgi:LPS O-antigen subunit length determinant protein (WzzB/FepE family)